MTNAASSDAHRPEIGDGSDDDDVDDGRRRRVGARAHLMLVGHRDAENKVERCSVETKSALLKSENLRHAVDHF